MEEARVGVFTCHCGLNIAGVIDVKELTEYARTLPDVFYAEHDPYTCSDPGQTAIKKAIKEYNLNRVVVAACSPRMHEPTFRRCVAEVGLNPYLFEMANIRELCSWAHPSAPKEATEKAKDLVRMAVAKARLLRGLEVMEVPVVNKALVLGGGIAGISVALNLADMGFKVYLVERSGSIGGHMAQLDKTFPTLDCSACILTPKMIEVSRHPNIELLAYSEVKEVTGLIGDYKVKILRKPRFVDETKCVGCGVCSEKCPIRVPSEFDIGLGRRKAIYVPFPQAVPLIYAIDSEHCLFFTKGICKICEKFCQRNAIDFEQKPREVTIEVGTIIIATGYDLYEPSDLSNYGYGSCKNVITGLQLERLLNAAGPTGGKLLRPSDRKEPKKVAFLQCVGSRDVNKYIYCSGFCCMYTLKNSILIKDHWKDAEIYVIYKDIRANFKAYEEFYQKAVNMGINFIRAELTDREIVEDPETNNLTIHAVTEQGKEVEVKADLVVLSTAAIPSEGSNEVARIFNIARGPDGFFMESHPKLKPIDTAVDGIFLAGACQGLKDIPYSVTQGSGAAARAATVLSKKTWEIEPIIAVVDPQKCRNTKVKCGICAEKCAYGAVKAPEGQPAQVTVAMCHGCGTCVAECPSDAITQMHFTDAQILAQIRAALEKDAENKILAFCCNWCSYAGADLAGTSRFEYPPTLRILRTMCSGRVDRDFVLEAFRMGAGMVLVAGCHLPYDCHYISGNYKMKARMESLQKVLEKLGVSHGRLRIAWISAAEGLIFADLVKEMTQQMGDLGIDRIKAENDKIRPVLERMLSRKGII